MNILKDIKHKLKKVLIVRLHIHLQRSISSLHKRSMFDIFDKYDTNHDNYLDGEEMADLFYVHGFPAHEAEIIGFNQVDMFDLDGDQLLSRWGEYIFTFFFF